MHLIYLFICQQRDVSSFLKSCSFVLNSFTYLLSSVFMIQLVQSSIIQMTYKCFLFIATTFDFYSFSMHFSSSRFFKLQLYRRLSLYFSAGYLLQFDSLYRYIYCIFVFVVVCVFFQLLFYLFSFFFYALLLFYNQKN